MATYTDYDEKERLKENEDNAGQKAPGSNSKDGSGNRDALTPDQIKDAENSGDPRAKSSEDDTEEGGGFYRGGERVAKITVRFAAKRGLRKYKNIIIGVIMLNLLVGGLLFLIAFLSPLKNIHFETVLRGSAFASFQAAMYKQFARTAFNAATLTPQSVGTWVDSPLVRQLRLATPDRQMRLLGAQDRIKWTFRGNGGFGHALGIFESLQSVTVINDAGKSTTFDVDEIAKQYGPDKDYTKLTFRQKLWVQSEFVKAFHQELGGYAKLMQRYVRWNPNFRLRDFTGARLVGWGHRALSFLHESPDDARKRNADEDMKRISPDEFGHPDISEVDKAAQEYREAKLESIETGEPMKALPRVNRVLGFASAMAKVSLSSFALTTGCIVKDLADYAADADLQRQAQAVRYAVTGLAKADQQKAGDVVAEAVGAGDGEWDAAPGELSDAAKSVIYLMALGEIVDPTSTEYVEQTALIPALNVAEWAGKAADIFKGFFSILPSAACEQILNPGTQAIIATAEVAAAIVTLGSSEGAAQLIKAGVEVGIGVGAGLTTSELIAQLSNFVINYYSNTAFATERGINKVGAEYTGLSLLAAHANRTVTYAGPVSPAEATKARVAAITELRLQNQQSSFANRYFAITNPYSLLGRVVAKMPSSTGGLAVAIQNGVTTLGSMLVNAPLRVAGAVGNLFTARSSAADETAGLDYLMAKAGVQAWNWTAAEEHEVATNPSFAMPDLLDYVKPHLAEWDALYGPCYDPNNALPAQIPNTDEHPCLKEGFLSSQNALHWRYYKAQLFAATQQSGAL